MTIEQSNQNVQKILDLICYFEGVILFDFYSESEFKIIFLKFISDNELEDMTRERDQQRLPFAVMSIWRGREILCYGDSTQTTIHYLESDEIDFRNQTGFLHCPLQMKLEMLALVRQLKKE